VIAVPDFDKLVEEQIREAIARGDYAGLPGRGRPQDLRVNPYVRADERMAQDMLAAQGFGLPWIEERRDLLRDRARLLDALRRAWERHAGGLPTAAARARQRPHWDAAAAQFRRDAEALNARIRTHNHTVPVPGMRVRLIEPDTDLNALPAP
jgi:Domain of unknown function (DUF1992)